MEIKKGKESDAELRRVPEFTVGGREPGGASTYGRHASGGTIGGASGGAGQAAEAGEERRRQGAQAVEKARERKKVYLIELEEKVKDLEKKNMELEERISTLHNENHMLRQILKNATANRRGSNSSNGESLA